ncbi:proline-rich protein PRCC-like [Babylonia areolata]|uniref:proline-rich protein PRCC-like n=1 Tax=Babylonia areolata TaxID=304850 RepID=UPI003FD34636
MSLVAYGASDDSETSDVEELETPPPTESGDADNRALADDGKISDEEDYVPTAKVQSTASTSIAVSSTREVGSSSVFNTVSSLSDLPAPKAVSTAEGGGEGEDELEEEVKPKASQLADAPKPPPKKVKQPARIVLPALKKDSDDEEEESKKKIKPTSAGTSGSRSGLFALLPPPTHSSRKQANRPLIPYTLTKRPAASSSITPPVPKPSAPASTTTTAGTLPSQKHQSAFNALTGYESDSDEEEAGGTAVSNFFSISNEAEEEASSVGVSVVKNSAPSLEQGGGGGQTRDINASSSSDSSSVPPPSSHSQPALKPTRTTPSESPVSSSSGVSPASGVRDSSGSAADKTVDSSSKEGGDSVDNDDDDNEVSSTVGVPVVNQDAPLTFSTTMQSGGWTTAPLTSPMLPEMYAEPVSSGAASYWQMQQHYAQQYEEDEQEASSSNSSDVRQYMEDEQFLRISGKRKRGQEDIQIIDANVDDYVDPSDLMKGISEESSYQPHRKKENMPSTQQRRKKQITYLAFQAKERELELKNAWSQNRMTKNQARSKYGF